MKDLIANVAVLQQSTDLVLIVLFLNPFVLSAYARLRNDFVCFGGTTWWFGNHTQNELVLPRNGQI